MTRPDRVMVSLKRMSDFLKEAKEPFYADLTEKVRRGFEDCTTKEEMKERMKPVDNLILSLGNIANLSLTNQKRMEFDQLLGELWESTND